MSQRLNWELVHPQWGAGGWVPLWDDTEMDLQSSTVAEACLTLKESKDTVIISFGFHLESQELYWDTGSKKILAPHLPSCEFCGISLLLNIRVFYSIFLSYLSISSQECNVKKNIKNYDETSANHNENTFPILSPQRTHLNKCTEKKCEYFVLFSLLPLIICCRSHSQTRKI